MLTLVQIILALLTLSMLPAAAFGQGAAAADMADAPRMAVQYTVSIDAPAPLDQLLEKNLDLMRFRGNASIDFEQLQRLVRSAPEQAKTLLATEGYFNAEVSAEVSPKVNPVLASDGARVLVKVEPGAPVLVDSVDLVLDGFASAPGASGAPAFDAQALKDSWSLKQGQVFRQSDWEQAKRALLRQVVQTRYPRAQMSQSQATVDTETRRARLRVELVSGPEMRFGEVHIEGLQRYPGAIVSKLNQIKPGDVYNEAALQAYQSRLQNTGYFSNVVVSVDAAGVNAADDGLVEPSATQLPAAEPGERPARLDILVLVTENKLQNISTGLGYSSNTGKRIQLDYDNLDLSGLKFKSALTLESLRQTAHGDFYFPTTASGGNDYANDSIGASFERNDIEGVTTGVAILAAKRAWGTPILARSLTLEVLKETTTVAGLESSKSKSLPLIFDITKRHLDSQLFPSQGYVVNLQLSAAPLPLLTDEAFTRASTRFVSYLPLGAHNTLILRGEAGALASKQKTGVPQVFLFRAGGDQSVRGYAYQQLGVIENGATVGGRYLATASIEVQHWFTSTWGAATFYDAGNASDSIRQLAPKSGYGLGARYKSPVGPINVDVAYGHAIEQYRLHFSLGFTF